LIGIKFELRIDHMSFKYLFNQPSFNSRQARWMEFLCEFDFEIKHVKGKESKVTYALSKKFHVAAMSVCKSNFREKVLEALDSDEFYLQVKEVL
jgi:hypothetical protein